MEDIIKISHDRYFDELAGLAKCVEILRDGGSASVIADEMERRIKVFGEAIKDFGIMLKKEAA